MHDDIHFGGQYHCGCSFCREKFEKTMGYPLPVGKDFPVNDFENKIWRDWTRFRIQSISDHLKEVISYLPEDFVFFSWAIVIMRKMNLQTYRYSFLLTTLQNFLGRTKTIIEKLLPGGKKGQCGWKIFSVQQLCSAK